MTAAASLPGVGDRFTVEEYPDRAGWLAARQTGLGGSDAPSLWHREIAESEKPTFGAPYALWCDKRGLLPPDDGEEADYLADGRILEPAVAAMYERRHSDERLSYPGAFTLLRSTEHPFLTVSLDRAIDRLGARTFGALECKAHAYRAAGETWRDRAPLAVACQVQHAMLVTGWSFGVAAGLVFGRYVEHELPRDADFLAVHLRLCVEMWARVEQDDAPTVTGHPADLRAVTARYAEESGETIDATEVIQDGAMAWELSRQQKRLAEAAEKAAEAVLRDEMKDATFANLPDGRRFKLATEGRADRLCGCGAVIQAGWEKRIPRIVKG